MPPGFLAVLTQPSSSLSLADFHTWYDEEHIPLRLNRLPAFLSGARYQAIDDFTENSPRWLAMYEIDDTKTFGEPSYTGLREKRSARETDVMRRLEVLVRWTGEDLGVWGEDGESSTSGLKVGKPSECVVTHILDVAAGQGELSSVIKAWADQLASRGKSVRGWVRMRVVKVIDGGKTKMGVAVKPDEAKYFVVHEFERVEGADTEALRGSASSIEGVEVDDWRTWKLHKAYPVSPKAMHLIDSMNERS